MSEENSLNQLTLFAEDFLASLTVLPGSDEARQMTVTSGRNIAGLLKNSSPLGQLLRMCLVSEGLYSRRCYLKWDTWDTNLSYLSFQLVPLMPDTLDKESLLFRGAIVQIKDETPCPLTEHLFGTVYYLNGDMVDIKLSSMEIECYPIEWIKPTYFWPTPAARDYRHPNQRTRWERYGITAGEQLPNAVRGPLNPEWVEWLMGFPIGWTELPPSETP